ncbi:MAG: prepilin-type N-terminal cleavage/methylation domain-containing protein [Luteolibacter sp.]
MKTHFRDSIRRGFTLMELMVAMAITTIIVTILVGITSVSVDAWTRSRAEVRANRQGKAMTDAMAADFQAMVTRKGNSFEWLYANLKRDSDLPGSSKVKSNNASSLIFFTAATDRYSNTTDAGGDVSCVSYKLDYKDPVSGNTSTSYDTFALYRMLVEPNETFTSLLGQTDLYTAFGSRNVSDVKNFVCENVYQFTLKFNVEVAAGLFLSECTPRQGDRAGHSDPRPLQLRRRHRHHRDHRSVRGDPREQSEDHGRWQLGLQDHHREGGGDQGRSCGVRGHLAHHPHRCGREPAPRAQLQERHRKGPVHLEELLPVLQAGRSDLHVRSARETLFPKSPALYVPGFFIRGVLSKGRALPPRAPGFRSP